MIASTRVTPSTRSKLEGRGRRTEEFLADVLRVVAGVNHERRADSGLVVVLHAQARIRTLHLEVGLLVSPRVIRRVERHGAANGRDGAGDSGGREAEDLHARDKQPRGGRRDA